MLALSITKKVGVSLISLKLEEVQLWNVPVTGGHTDIND